MKDEGWDHLSVVCFLPHRRVVCWDILPFLLSSNYPCTISFVSPLSFISLVVVRWCHLDMKVETSCILPAALSAGWPAGRGKFSTGMDSQQSVYLYLIIWQLQGRDSCSSTIPSWCLISHSFSYWIFLFKAALNAQCTLITQALRERERHWASRRNKSE